MRCRHSLGLTSELNVRGHWRSLSKNPLRNQNVCWHLASPTVCDKSHIKLESGIMVAIMCENSRLVQVTYFTRYFPSRERLPRARASHSPLQRFVLSFPRISYGRTAISAIQWATRGCGRAIPRGGRESDPVNVQRRKPLHTCIIFPLTFF